MAPFRRQTDGASRIHNQSVPALRLSRRTGRAEPGRAEPSRETIAGTTRSGAAAAANAHLPNAGRPPAGLPWGYPGWASTMIRISVMSSIA